MQGVFRGPGQGLEKYVSGSGLLYLSKSITLPHNERIVFDGHIIGVRDVAKYFQEHFENMGFMELVEDSTTWDGAWSLIYINSNGTVYAFTDPLGKKQLYYNSRGEISPSIISLVHAVDATDTDEIYKSEVNKWGYNTDDRTPWTHIKRVIPDQVHMFLGGTSQVVMKNYANWTPFLAGQSLRELVERSVAKEVMSIPDSVDSIGVLLSGGLDSSIIASILIQMRDRDELEGRKLNFYTINNSDDEEYVLAFEEAKGIKAERFSYDVSHEDMIKAFLINETPVDLGSMIPNQYMFSIIPEKVLFTGDGADELFGGYKRIADYDSQLSDVFEELRYYHLPRLEKAASAYGIDLRCPFLGYNVIRHALSIPYSERIHKACLKNAFRGLVPGVIIDRPKLPLKNDKIRKDPLSYRYELVKTFFENIPQIVYENL